MGPEWANLEASSFLVIQNCAEDAGLIEVGIANPIDRTVHPDKSNGSHVANDPVVFNRLISHRRVRIPSRTPFGFLGGSMANLVSLEGSGSTINTGSPRPYGGVARKMWRIRLTS